MKLTRKEAQPILKAAGSNYTGRKISVTFANKVSFYDTNWGGGTRNQYTAINMNTSRASTFYAPAPWINPVEGQSIELPENILVIEHSYFCGRDMGITIYAHPCRIPLFLKKGD